MKKSLLGLQLLSSTCSSAEHLHHCNRDPMWTTVINTNNMALILWYCRLTAIFNVIVKIVSLLYVMLMINIMQLLSIKKKSAVN